ncbi:type IV pilin protein [Paraglaciecola aestuariivivens]
MQGIKGLTLIELMIAIAIVGIIAVVAFPSFQGQVTDARRGEGITQLLQLQMQQESFRLENDSYATTAQLTLPASDYYTFSVENASATTYTLKAAAKGSQTKDSDCTPLTVDQSMNKSPAACWK